MDIYGIIGWPVEHSLSPAMHNAAFKKLGIDAEYRKFEVRPEELEDFILNRVDVKGFNITIPHKVKAKEIVEKYRDRYDSTQLEQYSVDMCGAVNTIKRRDSKIEYANTDVYGFRTSLEKDLGFDYRGKNVLLLGCGGAGRAVVAGLTWRPGGRSARKIFICESSKKALKSVRQYFSGWSYLENILEFIPKERIAEVVTGCQLLVNATPIGMKEGDDSRVIDRGLLHKNLYIYDVVYNRETQLIKDAKNRKLRFANGQGMFLYQGVRALGFWLDKKIPEDIVKVMKKALDKALRTGSTGKTG